MGALLATAVGCTTQPAPGLTAAETAYVAAICGAYERCSPEWGRLWVSQPVCEETLGDILAKHIAEVALRHAPDEASLACAAWIEELLCQVPDAHTGWMDGWLAQLPPSSGGRFPDFFSSKRTACEETAAAWSVPNTRDPVLSEPGAECSGTYSCQGSSTCLAFPLEGGGCGRCVPRVGEGEACDQAECTDGLFCAPDSFCRPLDLKACQAPIECESSLGYRCGADQHCEKIPLGENCLDDFGLDGLRCIAGLTAERSPLDGPCEADGDCALHDGLTCLGGRCSLPADRGGVCEIDRGCLGDLLCIGGRCTDRAGPGEPCDWFGGSRDPAILSRVHTCQLPLYCVEGICVQDHILGMGEPCARIGCCLSHYAMGRCSSGFCGFLGEGPPVCQPRGTVGDECDPGYRSAENCGPYAVCLYVGAELGMYRCVAYRHIGEPCDPEPCDGMTPCPPTCHPDAICGEDHTCRLKSPLGGPCSETSECRVLRPELDVECRGACQGGEFSGMPCLSSSNCGSGRCAGTCTDMSEPWSFCAP